MDRQSPVVPQPKHFPAATTPFSKESSKLDLLKLMVNHLQEKNNL